MNQAISGVSFIGNSLTHHDLPCIATYGAIADGGGCLYSDNCALGCTTAIGDLSGNAVQVSTVQNTSQVVNSKSTLATIRPWTPTLTDGTNTATVTGLAGNYCINGNLLSFTLTCNNITALNGLGAAYFTLPVAKKNEGWYTMCPVMTSTGFTANAGDCNQAGAILDNTNKLYIFGTTAAGVLTAYVGTTNFKVGSSVFCSGSYFIA